MAQLRKRIEPVDLSKIRRYSVLRRKTKAEISLFGQPAVSMRSFFDRLPRFLKANDLKALASDIIAARRRKRAIIWLMGAHPLKVGLSPVIIDLLRRRYISHVAVTGAAVIHDLEIAFWGRTSEEVAETLQDGSFGMVEETPRYLAEAVKMAKADYGLGQSVGSYIVKEQPPYVDYSIFATAYRLGTTISVHIAIGTDTICHHPEFDPTVWGKRSYLDFRLLCNVVHLLNGGGVVLNVGSAVILPEVFLKALTVARNLYGQVSRFTAANFDMFQLYRPNENVVRRPTMQGGKGYSFTGHHEIMVPLLAAAIRSFERSKDG